MHLPSAIAIFTSHFSSNCHYFVNASVIKLMPTAASHIGCTVNTACFNTPRITRDDYRSPLRPGPRGTALRPGHLCRTDFPTRSRQQQWTHMPKRQGHFSVDREGAESATLLIFKEVDASKLYFMASRYRYPGV